MMDAAGPEPPPGTPTRRSTVILWVGAGLMALAAALYVVRPWLVGAVGSDSASSVLYFDRLAAGVQLERFLGTTPKPFLTMVYGPIHALFADWRPISVLVVIVYGAAVATAACLAQRSAGSMAAGVFVAFGLVASAGLLQDASLAYTVSWSLLLWSIAGLAAGAARPRYGIAGLALLVAALIRPETLLIVALCGSVLVVLEIAARGGRATRPPRAAWLVLIALLAIPLGAVHDQLLTGDALYSLQVPTLGSEIRDPQSVGAVVRIVVRHLSPLLPMVLLGGLGVVVLVRRHAWPVLLGLTALGPGIAVFLVLLAARGVIVLDRYALPIDLTIILAGGVGFSALAVPILSRAVATRPQLRSVGQLAIAATLALSLSPTVAPLDSTVIGQIRTDRTVIADFGAARAAIAGALDAVPGVRSRPSDADAHRLTPDGPVALLVPARLLPQAAVDLGLPLTGIARTDPARLNPDGSYPTAGQLVYHDATVDTPTADFAFLEVGAPTTLGRIRVVPIQVDGERGTWIVRIDPP